MNLRLNDDFLSDVVSWADDLHAPETSLDTVDTDRLNVVYRAVTLLFDVAEREVAEQPILKAHEDHAALQDAVRTVDASAAVRHASMDQLQNPRPQQLAPVIPIQRSRVDAALDEVMGAYIEAEAA